MAHIWGVNRDGNFKPVCVDDEKQELIFKDGQEYVQVLRILGNGRCEAMCIDITNSHPWEDAQEAAIILKYMPDDARLLKAHDELLENIGLNEGITGGLDDDDDDNGIDDYMEFEDEDIDKI